MRRNSTLPFYLLVLWGLLGGAGRAAAADTLAVAARFYHVDAQQQLILINQPLAELNGARPTPRHYLALDTVYAFSQPVTRVATDTSYQVQLGGAAYTVYFTELPVVSIRARKPIIDTPSTFATFSLSEPGGEVLQALMGIEIRGGNSQSYPKKSFELSFWRDSTGAQSEDVRLLGMRTDNKYNLQAMYNEPLRLRSKVANELWLDMHQIYYKNLEPEAKNGIAIQYVEVFINDEYRGLYALSERIDRKQLKLKKYSNGIVGELYKGSDWGGAVTFTAVPPFYNTSDTWGGFEYKHPEEQIDWSNLHEFVDFVKNSSDQEFYRTYQQKFHLGNAVDYYIFLNLLRAGDNTGKNLYIAKYKKNEPYYYVPWDLDGVFGTDWTGGQSGITDGILSNGFYDRLIQDCAPNGFRAQLSARWTELRRNLLTEAYILDKFERTRTYLLRNNLYEREQRTWAGFEPTTAQYAYLAGWLPQRLRYLDGVFSETCAPLTSAASATQAPGLQLYPNPTSEFLTVESGTEAAYQVVVQDLQGRPVLRAALRGAAPQQLDVRPLPRGLYVVTIQTPTRVTTAKVLLR